MIIRAYVRHLVAPIGTQFFGECKSVFICGILTGGLCPPLCIGLFIRNYSRGYIRHYVQRLPFEFNPGIPYPLCIGRGIQILLCMATLFRIYIRRGVLKLLCWRSSTEFIYIRHVLIATTQRHTRPLDAIYPSPIRYYSGASSVPTRLSYAATATLIRTCTNKTDTTNEVQSKVIAVYGGLTHIEHRRDRLHYAKRKETFKWRSIERITPPIYAVQTKILRIHTIINGSTPKADGLRYNGGMQAFQDVSQWVSIRIDVVKALRIVLSALDFVEYAVDFVRMAL